MSLPLRFLDDLRTRLSLSDVVGRKVMWDQRKSNQGKGDMWAPCPFHHEETASFHVDDQKGFYYCFGCQARGDAISFVQETENVSFTESVEILASEAGMPMPAHAPKAQGPYVDLALHTIGWKAFQDMAAHICEVRLKTRVTIHHPANDGGQDAVFLIPSSYKGSPPTGTIQVKFSHDPKGSLKPSHLTPELKKLQKLVGVGEADSYILVTNMSVSAHTVSQIKEKLRELGVRKPEVWGKEEITRIIRESSKLRALVPQVYGLGDLTTILDIRAAEQTKAILQDWRSRLKAYVPTAAHARAVRTLDKLGIVLLLGNPSSGKTTIGAILSTMAVDDEEHSVIQITSPNEFEKHWNPDDKNRFFWVEDAFGTNYVNTGHIQEWTKVFPKVTASVNSGNRILFTSRNYIYRAAQSRLGSRNLHLFNTEAAIVDVGELSSDEKRQILYNHIKHGKQDEAWRTNAKQHLDAVAEVDGFLPGIAERLGNPDFTKDLPLTEDALCDFMAKPQAHLVKIINELELDQNAALTLIYMHLGRMDLNDPDKDAVSAVESITGCNSTEILARIPELAGSFTKVVSDAFDQVWGFDHPTISDAITAILDEQPNKSAAIIRGGPIEKVMSQFVCEDGPETPNAVKIPAKLNGHLNRRLKDAPDNWHTNAILFEFLSSRASDDVVDHQYRSANRLMLRTYLPQTKASYNEKYRAAARAHSLGALSDHHRLMISDEILKSSAERLDLSWLEEIDFVALIEPRALLSLGFALSSRISSNFDEFLKAQRTDINLDMDIEYQYDVISSGLELLKSFISEGSATSTADILEPAEVLLREEINEVILEQEVHLAQQEDDGDWDVFSPSSPEFPDRADETRTSLRSIFVDVDGV